MQSASKDRMHQVQRLAEAASLRKVDATRHKCFVSYHVADLVEVRNFVATFGSEFIPRSVGVTEDDDFVASDNTDYIKRRIREKYLTDSTVTILLLGECTWSRKFVDWEISSSLRDDSANRRSGLLVVPLPSRNNTATLPDRVRDNWNRGDPENSYVSYMAYPTSLSGLRSDIEEAYKARVTKAAYVDNSRKLAGRNSLCGS